jgi:hypothetical protein
MNNSYDEIKKLLNSSREMLGKQASMNEARQDLIDLGLINEQSALGGSINTLPSANALERPNIAKDTERRIQTDTKKNEDKQQAYRVSGGVVVMHGKTQQELEISSEEKAAFQETMDEFVDEVSELVDFYPLNVYANNVEWSGKVIDQDLEFYYSIGERNGVYINGTMSKVDDEFMEFIQKLRNYYNKFKVRWSKVVGSRKKTEVEK